MPTVLITTAIAPPENVPYLAMANQATRLLTTKAGIFFWAAFGVTNIVVADATNRQVLSEEEVQLLNQMNVNVEQLAFQQDDALIQEKGKGYAEGSLILHAVQNSTLLAKSKEFFQMYGQGVLPQLSANTVSDQGSRAIDGFLDQQCTWPEPCPNGYAVLFHNHRLL